MHCKKVDVVINSDYSKELGLTEKIVVLIFILIIFHTHLDLVLIFFLTKNLVSHMPDTGKGKKKKRSL